MFAESFTEVRLARGLVDETARRHRRAWLRPLTGWQEAALSGATLDPRGVSELLCQSLARLGGYSDPSAELMDALTRYDRQRLVLCLRQSLFGDRLPLTLRCPNPDCGELADMDLEISSLLPDATEPVPEVVEVQTPQGRALLREPTGVDDQVMHTHRGSHRERSDALWARLVLELDGRPLDVDALTLETRQLLALGLERISRHPELSFVTRCPECGGWIELHLDPIALLARELELGAGRLVVEVHALAFHYHWTEAEVLALSRTRRWRYLELVKRQVEGRPLLDTWT